VGYRAGHDRRGKSHHNVIRSSDRPAYSESFLYNTECSTCIYYCDFIGSSKYKNLRIMQTNSRANYELKCKGHGQHLHNSVERYFNEAIILVTSWSGGWIPVGARFPHPSRQALGPAQPPIQWGPGTSLVGEGVKRQERGINHTPASSIEAFVSCTRVNFSFFTVTVLVNQRYKTNFVYFFSNSESRLRTEVL
jgi:hypothetical protein